jgi:hypothetical protein
MKNWTFLGTLLHIINKLECDINNIIKSSSTKCVSQSAQNNKLKFCDPVILLPHWHLKFGQQIIHMSHIINVRKCIRTIISLENAKWTQYKVVQIFWCYIIILDAMLILEEYNTSPLAGFALFKTTSCVNRQSHTNTVHSLAASYNRYSNFT